MTSESGLSHRRLRVTLNNSEILEEKNHEETLKRTRVNIGRKRIKRYNKLKYLGKHFILNDHVMNQKAWFETVA